MPGIRASEKEKVSSFYIFDELFDGGGDGSSGFCSCRANLLRLLVVVKGHL